jgi:solute:Na+ symporter, SSS family
MGHGLDVAPGFSRASRLRASAFAAVLAIVFLTLPGAAHAAPGDVLSWTRLAPLPDALGVAGPCAGVSNGALIVAGGANFPAGPPWEGGRKVWHAGVWVLDRPDGTWRQADPLPAPRAYSASVTTPGGVLCIGGSDADRHFADVFLLAWDGRAVTRRAFPALPLQLANAAAALVGSTVYVAGGDAAPGVTQAAHRFFSLDLSAPTPSWRELAPWPGDGRTLAIAAAQDGAFFLIGGVSLSADEQGNPRRTYRRDAWRYRPGSGWTRIADLPRSLAASPSPAPAIGPSHLFVLGGDDGSKVGWQPPATHPGFAPPVFAYHTITDTWTETAQTPAPRATAPAVRWGNRIVVPSGEVRPGVRSPDVWSALPTGNKTGFGWLNYTTLGLYLAGMVWLGLSFTAKTKTTDDFFRASQRIPWWAAGLSIFSTMLSSITFMAIPAQGYGVGWNYFLANSYLIITPLVAWVFVPFYRTLDVTSAYEYLERRFDVAARMVASGLFILFQAGRVAIVLYLPALALATVSSLDVTLCIVLMGLLCIVYTVLGGIEAVIWTDVAQAVILLGGAVWALVTVVVRVDGGVGGIVSTAAAHGKFFDTVTWNFDYTIAAGWIIIIGSVFNNLFPYTASQDVVQRYVTTPDGKAAAKAVWTNAVVSPVAQAVFFAIGTGLFAFYRQHPGQLDPTMPTDAIFPLFIVRELPAGVAGVIVAGIFAAAQSTLSSSLNSVATAYVTDFHRRFRPGLPDASYLRLARWLTAVVGLAGTVAALVLARSDVRSLWETFLSVIGLFGGTISGLFLLGIFVPRAHARGALVGAAVGAALVFAVSAAKITSFWMFAPVGVISCVAVGWLASLVLPGPSEAPDGLTIYTLRRRP